MRRVITKTVGRFKTGQILDYPRGTWDQIAVSAKMNLEAFSSLADSVVTNAVGGQGKQNGKGSSHASAIR
jgi:hypothetical protein